MTTTCQSCVHTDQHGWHGIEGSAHCHSCHLTWKSKRAAHCPTCCEHFTSYSASDLHDGPNGCLNPSEIPGLKRAADGHSWRCADTPQGAFPLPVRPITEAGRMTGGREDPSFKQRTARILVPTASLPGTPFPSPGFLLGRGWNVRSTQMRRTEVD
jgi:hypothetical protein